MIVLATDYGLSGPYTGQLQAVLHRQAPGIPVISLFADLPAFDIEAAAYLLPAYCGGFPPGTVFLCVVDPGVGGERPGVVLRADARWYVGPDEGLFTLIARRARQVDCWRLETPAGIAASFHGRDVFAPVAARIARAGGMPGEPVDRQCLARPDWPDECWRVVYVDRFGNAVTGLRASALHPDARLVVNGQVLERARTFSTVASGQAFWYENANGLVELAVNRGAADRQLGIGVGSDLHQLSGPDVSPP